MDVQNRVEYCLIVAAVLIGIVVGLSNIGGVMAAWVSG